MLIGFVLLSVPCLATIEVIGTIGERKFGTSKLTREMQASYRIMSSKCSKCHSLDRIVEAVTTGIAPTTSQVFDDKAVLAYGKKMLRKPDANMNKSEVKEVLNLLNFLLAEAKR
jgi:hypothetical protein